VVGSKKMIFYTFIKKNSKLFFVLWCLLLIMISSIPNLPTPKIKALDSNIRLDYVIHFLAYFILSLFFMFWRMDTDSGLKFKKVLLFIVLGMCFALLDEIYQKLIPGRTFNIIDFMYDSIGFSIGIFSMFLIALVKNKPGSVVSSR
jgi:VanZ family protein